MGTRLWTNFREIVKPLGIVFGDIGTSHYTETYAPSLRGFEIKMGYMEIVDIEEMLQSHGIAIDENVIFYGSRHRGPAREREMVHFTMRGTPKGVRDQRVSFWKNFRMPPGLNDIIE